MATSGALERDFFILDGKVLTSGGSLNLTNGVLAIVDNDPKALTQNGRKVLSTFAGLSKDKSFQILLGAMDKPVSQFTTNKSYESEPFKIADIEDLRVEVPNRKGIIVDDFIIGYNGKAGTEIVVTGGASTGIDITLHGDAMFNIGYKEGKTTVRLELHYPYVDVDGNCIDCDGGVVTMQEIVEDAVAQFNATKLLGGEAITKYVDALVVNSLNDVLVDQIDYEYSSLTIVDNGDQTALARVQAQYPTFKVIRTDRIGDNSTVYTILAPAGTTFVDYTTSLSQILKGCEDCPAGYSELTAGVVYSITIEDDGADLTTTIDDVPGFVTGTVVKIGQEDGVGTYTVVTDNALTDAEIATFKAASAVKGTAVFDLAGDVKALCEDTTTTDTAWVTGITCSAVAKTFRITVEDDECGASRLAELQAAYPDLTIVEDTVSLSRTMTLTGTSGTANINIGGVDYLATFNTDLTTTASDFVTANAAAVLTDTGATLTSSGADLILVAPSETFPQFSIVNVTGNLAGTVAAAAASGAVASFMCQTTYRADVITNIVCDECSEEFRDLFLAEAPHNFGLNVWTTSGATFDVDAKMGIRFRGKPFTMSGSEAYRDDMPFYATSTKLSVAGGQASFIAESWNSQIRPFVLKVLSIAADPEALGGYLYEREDQARHNFDGFDRLEGNNYGKWLWGQESRLRGTAQYVQYTLTIHPEKYYKLLPHSAIKTNYNFIVELGKHEAIEALLNKISVAAGIHAVQAFAK